MSVRIQHDAEDPSAAIELTIRRPLPDFDLAEIEHRVSREVDPVLASQGFHDLLDEARSILGSALRESNLEVVQLTGAICSEGQVYRPGLWLVLRENGAAAGGPMSTEGKARVASVADELRRRLQLS
jgi:hypothetical protein